MIVSATGSRGEFLREAASRRSSAQNPFACCSESGRDSLLYHRGRTIALFWIRVVQRSTYGMKSATTLVMSTTTTGKITSQTTVKRTSNA
jgi:hypothetical protein